MFEEQSEGADSNHADGDARHEHVAEHQGSGRLFFRPDTELGQQTITWRQHRVGRDSSVRQMARLVFADSLPGMLFIMCDYTQSCEMD